MFKLGFKLAIGFFVAKRVDTIFENLLRVFDSNLRQYLSENNPKVYDSLAKLHIYPKQKNLNKTEPKNKIGFSTQS